jgi:hypothetical protein
VPTVGRRTAASCARVARPVADADTPGAIGIVCCTDPVCVVPHGRPDGACAVQVVSAMTQFKTSLNELISAINACEPSYIR